MKPRSDSRNPEARVMVVRFNKRLALRALLVQSAVILTGLELSILGLVLPSDIFLLRILGGLMIAGGAFYGAAAVLRLLSPKPVLAAEVRGLVFGAPFCPDYVAPWDRITRIQIKGPGERCRNIKRRLSIGIGAGPDLGIPTVLTGLSDPGESEINLDARTLDGPVVEIAQLIKIIHSKMIEEDRG